MLGHVEQIWQMRSHDTWCVWIQAVDGGHWARGKLNPLKSHVVHAQSGRCVWWKVE
jgi:hypothetical protein